MAFLFVILPMAASAIEQFDDNQRIEKLAKDRLWLRLLHLAAAHTQVISPSFYLSTSSSQSVDPLAELKINLKLARSKGDYRCHFPARDQWLRTQFSDLNFIAPQPCPELDMWQSSHPIQSASLVYPNHSLESSLSLFSHTFIKFNSSTLPLLSNLNLALGFAADLDLKDSFLKMVSLGLTGGYIGRFSFTNYYAEVNRYGEAELRDIFEYDLNFNKEELNFLLKHVWEIQNAEFHYYFFNGNCSYHLLTLFEIARPELDLSSHFHFVTIPLATVKIMLEQKNLIQSKRWIPGKQTRQKQMLKNLNSQGLAIYQNYRVQRQIPNLENELASLSTQKQITVLDLIAESTRGEPESAPLRNEVLNLRSHLPAGTQIFEQPLPKEMPEFSHGAHMVSLATGYNQNGKFGWSQLRFRSVLHGLMDPPLGYFRDTNLEIADFRIRFTPSHKFEESSLTFVNAFILNSWSAIDHEPTWQITSQIFDFLDHPQIQNNAGVGIGKRFEEISLYSMAIVDTDINKQEKNGYSFFSGASGGIIISASEKFKIRSHLDYLWPIQSTHEKDFWQGEIQSSYTLSMNSSLQFNSINSWRERSSMLEFLRYF